MLLEELRFPFKQLNETNNSLNRAPPDPAGAEDRAACHNRMFATGEWGVICPSTNTADKLDDN